MYNGHDTINLLASLYNCIMGEDRFCTYFVSKVFECMIFVKNVLIYANEADNENY